MTVALIAALVFASATFLASYRHSSNLLAFSVGLSAGFILLQFNGMHLFTGIVLLFAVFSGAKRVSVQGRCALIIASGTLLASTAWLGALTKSVNPAIQLIVLSITAVLFLLRSDAESVRMARYGLLVITAIGALVALGETAGLVPGDLFRLEGTEGHRVAGIYPEPDWLGLYSAIGVVIAAETTELRQRWRIALIALYLSGIGLASARTAVVALAVGLLWAVVRSVWKKRDPTRPRAKAGPMVAAGVLALIGALVVFPKQIELLLSRLQAAIEGDGAVVQGRWAQLGTLADLAASAPWYGNGLSASGRVTGFGNVIYGDMGGATNGANWLLSLLGDGKLLAIPIIAILIGAALFGNRVGSTVLLVVLVNSLFSNAFSFPITWLALALSLVPISKKPELFNMSAETTSASALRAPGSVRGAIGGRAPRAARSPSSLTADRLSHLAPVPTINDARRSDRNATNPRGSATSLLRRGRGADELSANPPHSSP